jgi:hypothetical protein
MPAGVASHLRRVQLGKESTWGTAVAATVILGGVTDVKLRAVDDVEFVQDLGRMGPGASVIETRQMAEGSIDMVASYEDLMYLLAGIFGISTSGAGPYVHTCSAPTTSASSPQKFTGEIGAPSNAYKVAGMLITKVTITGEAGGLVTATAEYFGQTIATVTLASLTDRAYEAIRMADLALFVDVAGGTMGSTAVPATLISFTLEIESGRHLKQFAGSTSPGDYGESRANVSLKTLLEFNSSAKAYFDALIAPGLVQRQVELKATSGSKIARFQVAGALDGGAEAWGDRDGNQTIDLTWRGYYNSTFGNYFKALLTNSVSTLA